MSRDIFEAVTAITHPLPDAGRFAATNTHRSPDDLDMVFTEVLEQAHQQREEYLNQLRNSAEHAAERDEEFDPLLAEIERCRDQMLAAERQMRLLVAYAREFVRPQPYPLKDLARAAGLSVSGVRIAYDEDEIREVGELTGDKPRKPYSDTQS